MQFGYMSVSFKINTSVMQMQSNFVSYIIFNPCGSLCMYMFRGRNLILLQNCCNFFHMTNILFVPFMMDYF